MAARDLVAEHQLLLDASKEAQRHRATNYKHVFKNKVARSSKLYRSGLRDQQKDMGPLGRRARHLPGAILLDRSNVASGNFSPLQQTFS